MSAPKDGGAAFPTQGWEWQGAQIAPATDSPGMSLRDYFAGKALVPVSIIGPSINAQRFGDEDAKYYAMAAYRIADAMLAERGKVRT